MIKNKRMLVVILSTGAVIMSVMPLGGKMLTNLNNLDRLMEKRSSVILFHKNPPDPTPQGCLPTAHLLKRCEEASDGSSFKATFVSADVAHNPLARRLAEVYHVTKFPTLVVNRKGMEGHNEIARRSCFSHPQTVDYDHVKIFLERQGKRAQKLSEPSKPRARGLGSRKNKHAKPAPALDTLSPIAKVTAEAQELTTERGIVTRPWPVPPIAAPTSLPPHTQPTLLDSRPR